MDLKLTWAPSSRADLRNLVAYIAQDDPVAAERMGMKIINQAEQASRFPESGRVVPEFGLRQIREFQVPPYRIIFRVKSTEGKVEMVRIWHASKDRPVL